MDRISPTADLAFKKVLGSEENKDILAGFIKKLLIPIITSIILFAVINIAVKFFFSKPLAIILSAFFTEYNDWGVGGIEKYLFENHYFLFPLSAILQSILLGVFMILGYNSGYKKREKERQELISKKND